VFIYDFKLQKSLLDVAPTILTFEPVLRIWPK